MPARRFAIRITIVTVIIVVAVAVTVGYASYTKPRISTVTSFSTYVQTVTSNETYRITTTRTTTLNLTNTVTVIRINQTGFPFDYPLYLSSSGFCTILGPNGTYDVPCFDGDFKQAYVFECASAAASSSGCTQQITSSLNSKARYNITVWYPYSAHSGEPGWANCMFYAAGEGSAYAYCISVSQTEFLVSQPGPPPP